MIGWIICAGVTYIGVGIGYGAGVMVGVDSAFEKAGIDPQKLTVEEYLHIQRELEKKFTGGK